MAEEELDIDQSVNQTCCDSGGLTSSSEEETTYSIPIGPLHPALKEPIQFQFQIDGEEIVGVDLKPGYAHRGIEYMGMKGDRNILQVLYLSERICGICSTSHPVAFTLAVEDALDMDVPPRAQYIRTIIAELERIHSHILWAGVAAHELGFDTLLHDSWRVREQVMDILEYLTGNRVNYGMFTVGGVRRDVNQDQYPEVQQALDYYKELYDKLVSNFLHDPTMELRTREVGILPKQDAKSLCSVGPTGRASGINKDVRVDQPYLAYADMDLDYITPDKFRPSITGDAYDKIVVRLLEVNQSVQIIQNCLDQMPEGELATYDQSAKLLSVLKQSSGEGIGRHEAPRGEVFHYVKLVEGRQGPKTWKVRAPTYANLMPWKPMFLGDEIADIPLIAASIDPCICCMDRATIVDGEQNREVYDKSELIKLSRQKTEDIRSKC